MKIKKFSSSKWLPKLLIFHLKKVAYEKGREESMKCDVNSLCLWRLVIKRMSTPRKTNTVCDHECSRRRDLKLKKTLDISFHLHVCCKLPTWLSHMLINWHRLMLTAVYVCVCWQQMKLTQSKWIGPFLFTQANQITSNCMNQFITMLWGS